MAKRRDSKGRVLRTGEYQRGDGRYCFRYTDAKGSPRTVYSWTLTKDDKSPVDKKPGPCLRKMEEAIQRDLFRGVAPEKQTVLQLVSAYVQTRVNVRRSTQAGYRTTLKYLENDAFGHWQVEAVRASDAKRWLIDLQHVKGKSYSAICSMRGVLRPAFRCAVEDGRIPRNPFDFELSEVLIDDGIARRALSQREERLFLDFVKGDSHFSRYYDGFLILFETGLRVSELCGLTVGDIDLKEGSIEVRRQLQRTGSSGRYIEEPKTPRGIRKIPMAVDVRDSFKRIVASRDAPVVEPVVDGVSGFLFLDKNGQPCVANHWEKYFKFAVAKYNRTYKEPLPKITPHVCRHTYCTNMIRNGMSAPRLMYLMGHSSIDVTIDTYTHLGFEDIKSFF